MVRSFTLSCVSSHFRTDAQLTQVSHASVRQLRPLKGSHTTGAFTDVGELTQ